MARVLILLLIGWIAERAPAEPLWPLPFGRTLTGGFADSRPDHFHGGVDLRTGPEHRPIVAPTDGFIERIQVSPAGYGRSLYFRMSDGRTAVFGHLNEFVAPLETLTRDSQLTRDNYRVDFATDSLAPAVRFKRGDVIAYSGDSGAGASHLHFEIREGAVQVDPLQFYSPRDSQPPVITGLSWIGLSDYDPWSVGTKLTLTKRGEGSWQAPAIESSEPLAFLVTCYDPGPWGRHAVPAAIRVRVNDEPVYAVACGRIDLLGPKSIYDQLVYAERDRHDADVRRLFCNPPSPEWSVDGSCEGWLAELRKARVEIEVMDRAGNSAVVAMTVTSGRAKPTSPRPLPDRIDADAFSLATEQSSYASWATMTALGNEQVRIAPAKLAFGDRLELSYLSDGGESTSGRYFFEQKPDGSRRALWRIPGRPGMACYIMKAGTYGVAFDAKPPTVRCSAQHGRLYVGLTDDASGIDDSTVHCKVDGERAILDFDFEARGGPIWTPRPLSRGPHTVELDAADRAGNAKHWVLSVTIP